MPKMKPLEPRQQNALSAVREARLSLEAARRNKSLEVERRMADVKARITVEVGDQITALERALDELMLEAVDQGVPIRRIATEAFSARYDGSVRRMIHLALADRRGEEIDPEEKPVSGNSLIPAAHEIIHADEPPVGGPRFTLDEVEHVLYEDEQERITVVTVKVELDPLDSWIGRIREFGRKGSETLNATVCTIYKNPGDGKMLALESKEPGETFYDHLAARWVKDHQTQARFGYERAIIDFTDADA